MSCSNNGLIIYPNHLAYHNYLNKDSLNFRRTFGGVVMFKPSFSMISVAIGPSPHFSSRLVVVENTLTGPSVEYAD